MSAFKTIRHRETFEGYQGCNLTEFKFHSDNNISEDQVVDNFLHSDSFKYDSLLDAIKREPNQGYLGRAFDIDKVTVADFIKVDKKGVINFLVDFSNKPDWGDDREDFSNLLDKYFEVHSTLHDDAFYIISKDWFDKKDERLLEPQCWCYIYYFLIIYFNKADNILLLTEWTYD